MVQISKLIRKKLGEILVDEGVLKEEALQEALKRQRATGELLGEALVTLGFISEVDIAKTIVRQFGLPYVDASRYNIPKDALKAVSSDLMFQNNFVVLDRIGKTLLVAVSGVLNGEIFEAIEKQSGSPLYVFVSTSSQVTQALQKHLPQAAAKPVEKKK